MVIRHGLQNPGTGTSFTFWLIDARSFIKELPADRSGIAAGHKELAHRGKALLKDLASISLEMAQMVVCEENGETLPNWLMVEIVRDLPRLVVKKDG